MSKSRTSANSSNMRKPIQKNRSESNHSESDEEFEVEKILDYRLTKNNKSKEYLVKWKNWSIEDSTWEPVENLSNVKDILAAFEKNMKKKESQQPPAPVPSKIKKVVPQVKPTISRNESTATTRKEETRRSSRNDNKKVDKSKRVAQVSDSEEDNDASRNSIEQEEDTNEQARNGDEDIEEEIDLDSDKRHDASNSESQSEQIEELVYEQIIQRRDIKAGVREYLVEFQKNNFQWIREEELSDIIDEVDKFNAAKDKEEADEAMELEKRETRSKDATAAKKTAKRSVVPQPAETERSVMKTQKKQPTSTQTPNTNTISNNNAINVSANKMKPCKKTASSNMAPAVTTVIEREEVVVRPVKAKHREVSEMAPGDFKTDNVAKLVLQGELDDILSSRFEVHWKPRRDGLTPSPCYFSSSYLKRFEPTILIDYLVSMKTNAPTSSQMVDEID